MTSPEPKTIAVVMYQGLTVLDAIGPLQVLKTLEQFSPAYQCVTVAETTRAIETDIGVSFFAEKTFVEVPNPFAIVVPGGSIPTLRALTNKALREYVSAASETAEVTVSVCTGALILASVGLLTGRTATTHWAYQGILESFGAHYSRCRWVEDGKFIMSAGVSAGIDMALYLVSRLTDEATSRRVQEAIDYDPAPPLGRIDWQHLGIAPRALRAAIRTAAPFVTRKPKQMTRAERAARATRQSLRIGT